MLIHWILFLCSGLFAGVVNSLAGGGSFIIFPLLVSTGLSPIMANATTTIVVQPGTLTSAIGYRQYLKRLPKRYFLMIIPGFLGGFLGASILQHTSNTNFGKIVPFFILFAVLLLLLQPTIHRHIFDKKPAKRKKIHVAAVFVALLVAFFILAIYGGYFGAGYGIMALGLLGLTELKDINQMNGLKNIVGVALGISSVGYFISHHLIDWNATPILITSNIVGGYIGAVYGSKLPANIIRTLIIIVGLIVSGLLFHKYYSI